MQQNEARFEVDRPTALGERKTLDPRRAEDRNASRTRKDPYVAATQSIKELQALRHVAPAAQGTRQIRNRTQIVRRRSRIDHRFHRDPRSEILPCKKVEKRAAAHEHHRIARIRS